MLAALASAAFVPMRPAPEGDWEIRVDKSERRLVLTHLGRVQAKFPIALGPRPSGQKHREGDGRTPEGVFRLTDKGPSPFHLWLGLNYPTAAHADGGRLAGTITWSEWWLLRCQNLNGLAPSQRTALGSFIGIHGGGAAKNWTLGCVALENQDVEYLYSRVPLGTRVVIRG